MSFRFKLAIAVFAWICLASASYMSAQQKPQWMPGQMGLNAGILPSPGFSYVNMDLNYDAGAFNDRNGKAIPVTGTYNVWAVENIFYYVPDTKFLRGNLGFMVIFPTIANGSLVAELPNFPNLGVTGGGAGLADLFVQPFTVGWHLKRWDIQVADGIMIPTGRYTPGASNNIGTGYFGNHLQSGTTYYITKNKGTSANLFTDWEVHGQRQGTNNTYKTPGQAFTDEWGVGQVLPVKKDLSQLLQLGAIGYDQWEITNDGGSISVGGIVLPAKALPHYSVHAVGGQLNYILPAKNFSLFFKYEHEYSATSHTLGNTICFDSVWTLLMPKAKPAATPAPKS
jgi:hypothetical protein